MGYKYVIGKNNRKFYYKEVSGKWERIPNKIGERSVINYNYRTENATAAGIIVLRKFDKEFKLLALKGNKDHISKKNLDLGREYDIPKGRIESGESPLKAAIRETDEESSITELNFQWGLNTTYRDKRLRKQLVVFLATTDQDPKIKKNPKTGILEHSSAKWLSFKEMKEKCYKYLQPVIEWGEKTIKVRKTIKVKK